MKLSSAGATDQGKRRSNNEDAFLVNGDLRLFAVADGVGGQEGGEVASSIAVETLAEALPDLLGREDRTPAAGTAPDESAERAALRTAVNLADKRILGTAAERPELAGMGTTLTALFFAKDRVHLAHIGDSRAYLLRAGKLRQWSNDHSLVAEQVRAGLLTAEQAHRSIYRHVITRVLGAMNAEGPDLLDQPVRQGDTYLLCSDGLTEMVEDREIERVLGEHAPDAAARRLIEAANAAGGADNITVVVVKVLEP